MSRVTITSVRMGASKQFLFLGLKQVPELGTAQNEFLFINSKMSKLKLSQYQRTGYHTPVIYFDLSPPDLGT